MATVNSTKLETLKNRLTFLALSILLFLLPVVHAFHLLPPAALSQPSYMPLLSEFVLLAQQALPVSQQMSGRSSYHVPLQ